ncbi:SMI1/KNR4 family protein [Pedobacter aquatilis]|uniref:SMI1/KNR4 family protein n=1 Tax=Pedobacter aquatilis TaxID=351343 RepID=UPI00292E2EE5|nr:SMI1/KNR4 family protein [Pedobacter aquatilis]
MENIYKDFFTALKKLIIELNIEEEFNIKGCTDEEIELLEKRYETLPLAYIEYLKSMGKESLWHFFDGEEISYEDLDDLNEFANKKIKKSGINITRKILAISHYRYDYFTFFYLNERHKNPDPKIWMFDPSQNLKKIKLSENAFTDMILFFLERSLKNHPNGFYFVSEEDKRKNPNVIKSRFFEWFTAVKKKYNEVVNINSENLLINDLNIKIINYYSLNKIEINRGLRKLRKSWWKFW